VDRHSLVRYRFAFALLFASLFSLTHVPALDCNFNAITDTDEIAADSSLDCNENGIPDECEFVPLSFGAATDAVPLSQRPTLVATGDLNGDGHVDVVVGSRVTSNSSPRLFVLLGEGNTALLPGVELDPGKELEDLVISDVDGDGDLDVAIVDLTSAIRILTNDGSGNLTPAEEFPTDRLSTKLYACDLTGDGFDDFVTVSPSEDSISWLVNQGNGSFGEQRSIVVGDLPVAAAPGDYDGDGDLDLAVAANREKNIRVLYQHSVGEFQLGPSLPLGRRTRDVAAGDLNGDGLPELAASGVDNLRIYLNEGQGEFAPAVLYSDRVSTLQLDDINFDGLVDVWAADFLGESLLLYLGSGGGHLAPRQRFLFEFSDFVSADLDGDGDPDLVLPADEPNRVGVFANGEVPPLTLERYELQVWDRPHFIDTGDFNEDGVPDIVTVNGGDRSYVVFLGQGDGTFAELIKRSHEDFPAWAIQVADLNGDGTDDQIHRDNQQLTVLLGHGDASFAKRVLFSTPGGFNFLLGADVDEDGRVDMIATASNAVTVHFNDGTGDLSERKSYRTGNLPTEVAVGDIDGDGRQDIATANLNSSDVSVLLREDGRTFAPTMTIPVEGGPFGIVAIDLDRDGDLDLATANQHTTDVSVLLNQGGGLFAPASTFPLERSPRALLAADLDGDNFEDLVATNEESDSLTILRGLGGGLFSAPQQYPVESGPRQTASADLDGDGDIDLVVAGRVGQSVSVILNQQPLRDGGVDSLPGICTPLELASVSVPGSSASVVRQGIFLLPAGPDPLLLAPLFPNAVRFPALRDFLVQVFPERFGALTPDAHSALVNRRDTREYFTGSLRQLRTENGILYGFDVLTEPDAMPELLTADETNAVFDSLSEVFALRPLSYMPTKRAAFDAAAAWAKADFPVVLLEEALDDFGPIPQPRSTPEFELEIPTETILCGVFSEAGEDRGLREEYLLKSTVTLQTGIVQLPTTDDTFEKNLFEQVTFGPTATPAIPLAPGVFQVVRVPAVDDVTTYRFTYSQDFLLEDDRVLEIVTAAPLQYRARGEEPLQRRTPLPEAFFVAIKGREALQASLDGIVSMRFGSCTYNSLPRWNVEFDLANGNSVRLREHFEETANEFETAPANLRQAEVQLGNERRIVTDYSDLVYSASRHNTRVEYWVTLDPPVRVDDREVWGLELRAPELPGRPEPQAAYLNALLEPLAAVAVSNFRREPLTRALFQRGDADADGRLTLIDAIRILDFLFHDAPSLACNKAGDTNDDGKLSIADTITLVGVLFGDDSLPAPFPGCGEDPTADRLTCEYAGEPESPCSH
jgi:hypothetical protein